MNDEDRHTPVRIYTAQPDTCENDYARGGLVSAAGKVRDAGRNGDSMVIHINKHEFDELRSKWGDPTINPDTGMPEFFNVGKFLKKAAGPIVGGLAGAFAPVIGTTLSGALPGVASLLGSTGMQALGAAGLGAGVGYLTNGGKGGVLGGLAGIAGSYGADWLNGGFGDEESPLAEATALPGVARELAYNPNTASGSGVADKLKGIPTATLLSILNMGGQALSGGDKAAEKAAKFEKKRRAEFNKPLVPWTNPRRRADIQPRDYTQAGETNYFENNGLGYADGGLASVDGRSDSIDARLSEGEYIMDAETVALIGNGSNEAGADRLDQLRANVRRHKGAALANGQISPDAAPLEQYLGSA